MDCISIINHPMADQLNHSCVAAQQRERGMDEAWFSLLYRTNNGVVTLWVDPYKHIPNRKRATQSKEFRE